MEIKTAQFRSDIYCAGIFSAIAFAASLFLTIIPAVGMFFAFIAAAVIGFFTGWFAAPLWGRIVLGTSALTGFIAALCIRGTQRFFISAAALMLCLALGAISGAICGNAHDKRA